MATTKEAISVSYTQAPETLGVEQNSFARFIDENRDLFERHSSLTYELRDEEEGWKNSPTLDSVAEKNVELAFLLYPKANNLNSKAIRKVREQIKVSTAKVIFDNSSEKDRLIASALSYSFSLKARQTPKSDALSNALEESINEFRENYFEARQPLVSGIRESRAELMRKFEDFLLEDPFNLFAFGDFLSDKKNYGAQRESIRPFLVSLAETEQSLIRDKKEGTLRRVVKKWIDELKEKPNPATIDEFAASIKSPNVLEWLEFAAQGKNIADFLKSRPDVSTWTTELKNALTSFISSKYLGSLSSVEKELEQFRRPLTLKVSTQRFSAKLEAEMGKVSVKIPGERPQDNNKEILEKPEKEKYPVGILTKEIGSGFEVRVLTEEELSFRLQKEADSLAPADQRMIADLEKILLSLQEDPYGLGTKKLTDKFVGVGNRSLPLRSINPRKRMGLSLDHPESTRIRVTYVIDKNGDFPTIGIEGIYKHEEYDKKFIS